MASFITYGIVTLTIDGVTSFPQLLDVKKYAFQSRQELREILTDGGIVIDYEGFVLIFNLFVC